MFGCIWIIFCTRVGPSTFLYVQRLWAELSYLRGRWRRWLRLPGPAPPWFSEPAVVQRWRGLWRLTERWPGPTYSPYPAEKKTDDFSEGDDKKTETQEHQSLFCLDTDVCAVCSGGAVGLLLQLDLLQLLFLHQGQLLLMLLVLFGCESWGREIRVCKSPGHKTQVIYILFILLQESK